MTYKVFVLCFVIIVTKAAVGQRFHNFERFCGYGQRPCGNGCISGNRWCDGHTDCPDGSDELPYECGPRKSLSNCTRGKFNCGNECIDFRLACNGEKDCADGRDETESVCRNKMAILCQQSVPMIKNGRLSLDYDSVFESHNRKNLKFKTTCDSNYALGNGNIICVNGTWTGIPPECSPCGITSPGPRRTTPEGDIVQNGVAPWHAGIYNKLSKPHRLICGATLINAKYLVSAAQCFWSDEVGVLPATVFAIAAGKTYSGWDDDREIDAQFSEVDELIVPEQFLGETRNMRDNIALVAVSSPFEFTKYVKPICLKFNKYFSVVFDDYDHMIGAWGLSSDVTGYKRPGILKIANIHSVRETTCRTESTADYKYLIDDKLCASRDGIEFGPEVAGSGLTYNEESFGESRTYLRGVVSIGKDQSNSIAIFTNTFKFEKFLGKFQSLSYYISNP